MSPKSVTLLLLLSVTVAVLVASMAGDLDKVVSVGSSIVLPSLSSPSSEVSVALLVLPGLLAAPYTLLNKLPLSRAA